MDRAEPVAAERPLVRRRRVPLVALEVEARVVRGGGPHHPVAGHLGQDGRGGDGRTPGVRTDDRLHRALVSGSVGLLGTVEERGRVRRAHVVERAVQQHRVGPGIGRELGERASRRQAQRRRHPQAVALVRRGVPDGPGRAPPGHRVEHRLADLFGQLFGIAQAAGDAARCRAQHRHADAHRAGPRPPTDLVHAAHETVAGVPQAPLEPPARAARSRGARCRSRCTRGRHVLTSLKRSPRRHGVSLAPCCPPPPCAHPRGPPIMGIATERRYTRFRRGADRSCGPRRGRPGEG